MQSDHTLDGLKPVILAAFPELSRARFELLTAGWDSVAVEADGWIFKFPRDKTATKALIREARLLSVVRPKVTLRTPELQLLPGPPIFSRHAKLPGEHLLTDDYARLDIAERDRAAADLARFFVEVHAIDAAEIVEAGAGPIDPFPPAEEVLEDAWPLLSPAMRAYAEETMRAWADLGSDPQGVTYGFFDGHGWNLAYDPAARRLNGVYDFADSGFGDLHQEFIYPNFVSRDFTARIVGAYEALRGVRLDMRRIDILTGVLRLTEVAQFGDWPERAEVTLRGVETWALESGWR
jgi:aminoglycoside phosphotransferase (APT) family kinase protein